MEATLALPVIAVVDIVYTMGKGGVKYNFHDFGHFPHEKSRWSYENSYNFHEFHDLYAPEDA